MAAAKPVLLLILDGFGHRVDPKDNAIAHANAPNWRALQAECPHTLIQTHGLFVGLPDGQMGNSEVGHMNIGAGRVVYQDLTRIEEDIRHGRFATNAGIQLALTRVGPERTLHVLALLSPGGVHSHEEHVFALLREAAGLGLKHLAVHAFLDGRDTPPKSAGDSLARLEQVCAETGARIATICGRYWAMDRDQRWDRMTGAWSMLVDADAEHHADTAEAGLAEAYARGETDEFVKPTVVGTGARIEDGDSVLFLNFRADRARQLARALADPGFDGFVRPRRPALAAFVTLTEYAAGLPVSAVCYAPQSMRNTLPEMLANRGLKQLRIAETEKYAHVTFFFNGGREEPFDGEERILVQSPAVATYDLQPEMSLPELTDRLCEAIRSRRFDAIFCNIANPDMVGHTGVFAAAVKAVEAVDVALGRIRSALSEVGGAMLITADHGNLEMMRDPETGEPHTQHTVGPVPLVGVGIPGRLRDGGSLCDLAPTVLDLLGIDAPAEMDGRSLLQR
ncbi:MAG: 2,3-bisphosphoglycerate-independent phosphoglycerate mutase [Ahniella sp.]|nr:2,3-bisphosphoglycerate-independent phosphoglycerate mutase [Ahniella sp.]